MKLTFRKSDRDAVILLFLVITVAVLLFPILSDKGQGTKYEGQGTKDKVQSARDKVQSAWYEVQGTGDMKLEPFDPNTADSAQFLRLGLRPWQVRNIYKYRAKGGRYRHKEDFAQLYGLTLEHYRRLEPYIRIKPEVMARDVIEGSRVQEFKSSKGQEFKGDVSPTSSQITFGETIDINTADTTALKRIPGIGSYYARRIVELRQRRQAFVSPEDLLVIRNFPETALSYMTVSHDFEKVHVNHLSLQQLKAHPLINHPQAADILRYRRLNGNICSAADMSNLPSFTREQLARLAPFLLFD